MKGTAYAPKAAVPKTAPDLEEAVEASDVEDDTRDVKKEEEEANDISKDKYIKAPKKKKAPVAGKGKAKKRAADSDDDGEPEPPKKAKRATKAKK